MFLFCFCLVSLHGDQCKYTASWWVSPRYYTVDPMLLPLGNPFKCHEEVFGLESGGTTQGSSSLVLYYDHINSITRNTQLLYICYFSPICYLVPINPEIFPEHDNHRISLELY